MAKVRGKNAFDVVPPARPGSAPWQTSYGLYIAGSEAIDDMKLVIRRMDEKWGIGALRMMAKAELREKFDRQRYLVNQAIWTGSLEEVRLQTKRMVKAYEVLDRAVEASEGVPRPIEQWEVALDFGAVLVVVQHPDDAAKVKDDGRKKVVWSLQEVANLIDSHTASIYAKIEFPGATVERFDTRIGDPLDRLRTSGTDLDDDISDLGVVNDCPF